MTNYEKALQLLDNGIARKHYTFERSGCITLDLGGAYAGYISLSDRCVDVSQYNEHVGYGNIDLDKMTLFDTSNRNRYNLHIKKWEDAQ